MSECACCFESVPLLWPCPEKRCDQRVCGQCRARYRTVLRKQSCMFCNPGEPPLVEVPGVINPVCAVGWFPFLLGFWSTGVIVVNAYAAVLCGAFTQWDFCEFPSVDSLFWYGGCLLIGSVMFFLYLASVVCEKIFWGFVGFGVRRLNLIWRGHLVR